MRTGQLPAGQQATGGLEQQVEVVTGLLGDGVDDRGVLAPRQAEPVDRHTGQRVDVRPPHRVGGLTRTQTGGRRRAGRASMATVDRRASSFAAAGTASSRSITTASAAEASALRTRSGRWPGT